MRRETIKKLHVRLNGLRDRFPKQRYFFQRKVDPATKAELIRVAFKSEVGILGLVNYMPPAELMRWLEGCVYGYNSCWYNTTE